MKRCIFSVSTPVKQISGQKQLHSLLPLSSYKLVDKTSTPCVPTCVIEVSGKKQVQFVSTLPYTDENKYASFDVSDVI